MSVQSLPAQHSQRVLKTKVQVIGRFIIRPDEEFNAMVAKQLIDKAKRRHVKVSTELRVFDTGVQLGDHGVFASMPIEFIRYYRLSDLVVLTNEPTTLVVCVKDYEQRCVTVMRLKDAVSLKVVIDVVNRLRAAFMEEFAKSSEMGSTLQRPVQQKFNSYARNNSNGSNGARQFNSGSRDHTDSAGGRAVSKSSEPDYAVIRRRNLGPQKPPAPPPPAQLQTQASGSSGGFFTRITVPAGPTYKQQQQSSDWSTQEHQRQSFHEQYQVRRSQLLQSAQGGGEISTDDLEMAAVFETRDGPPTLLNEPSRYVARVTDGEFRSCDVDDRPRQRGPANDGSNWRLAQQSHFNKGGIAAFRIGQQ